MTLNELIKAAEALRELHDGETLIGASVVPEIMLSVALSGPPVRLETADGVKDVILLIVKPNGD